MEPAPLPCTIVTGASSGIGWALSCQLLSAGVPVIAIGRNEARLRELADSNSLVTTYAADLTDLERLPALAHKIVSAHPHVGCLINNAGIQLDERLDDTNCTPQGICQEVNVNLTAPMVLTHALLPHLLTRKASCVVNVTSALGYVPKRTAAVYSASKGGLHLFTQALRVQMEGRNVRVVEVILPLVDTPMTAGRSSAKLSADEAARRMIEGLLTNKPDIRIGKVVALPWLQRWAPGLAARVMQRS